MGVLRGIAAAIGEDETYFDAAFTRPMALLRGNYYPPRRIGPGTRISASPRIRITAA